jgi:hypothetical protein
LDNTAGLLLSRQDVQIYDSSIAPYTPIIRV